MQQAETVLFEWQAGKAARLTGLERGGEGSRDYYEHGEADEVE